MSDLKIEWVFPDDLYERDVEGSSVPVVHLKQVDALMKELEWAMEHLHALLPKHLDTEQSKIHDRVAVCLNGDAVTAWRKRQEVKEWRP